jgi:hypothetical protein
VRDGVKGKADFSKRPSGIFSQGGLDHPNQIETADEISFYAQIIYQRRARVRPKSIFRDIGDDYIRPFRYYAVIQLMN